jgi:hypothetical protein
MDTAAINRNRTLWQRCTAVWPSVVGLLAVVVLCGACNGQPTPVASVTASPPTVAAPASTPAPTSTPSLVRVLMVAPVSRVTRNDEYYFDNCSGGYPVTRPFSEAARVTETLTLAEQASAISTNATVPIPAEMRAKLEAEIKLAYQETAQSARSLVSQTTLFCNAHDRNNTVIVWEERTCASVVSFPLDGVAYSAEYTYLLEVPRPGTVKPGICTP